MPNYIHLLPGVNLPPVPFAGPYAAVIIIEADVTNEWRDLVSEWLVRSGCLFMMAWGVDCALWDDSVDYANIAGFKGKGIPEDRYVYTTWHEDEELDEVFQFAGNTDLHPVVRLENIVLVDIAIAERRSVMLNKFARAIAGE